MRIKISKIAKDLNVGVGTVVDFLAKHNIIVENNPNARVDEKAEALLMTEFSGDKADKSLVDNTIDKRKADRKEKADRRSAGGSASDPVRQAGFESARQNRSQRRGQRWRAPLRSRQSPQSRKLRPHQKP